MYPKVSIITVCFNASRNIERTLISIKNQTYPNIEYIIIDGKSTDDTLNIVNKITPFAIVKSEKDKGIYDAMNKGLEIASGDYVWFMNAGDAIADNNTLEDIITKIQYLDKYPDIIYGDTIIIDNNGNNMGLRRLRPPKELVSKSFLNGMLVCHQAFIVKKAIAPKYNTMYKFSSDFDWCINCIKKSNINTMINEPIAQYLNEGTTTQNHKKSLIERFIIMKKHYGIMQTIIHHIKFIFVKER